MKLVNLILTDSLWIFYLTQGVQFDITLYQKELFDTKTKKSKRSILITDDLSNALKEFKNYQSEYGKKLGNIWKNPYNKVIVGLLGGTLNASNFKSRYFNPVLSVLGLEQVNFHSLRHSHATHLLQMDIHPKIVQERLGHSTINITLDTYSHLVSNLQKVVVDALEELGI